MRFGLPNSRQISTSGVVTFLSLALGFLATTSVAQESKTDCPPADPGWTEEMIKLGGSFPLSGPVSSYGTEAKGWKFVFDDVNRNGGINGRKIEYIAYDDGYVPSRTVDAARRLVEKDNVFAVAGTLGTATNLAIRPYLNERGVPQLFASGGATQWGKGFKKYPWTIGFQVDYATEMRAYVKFLDKNKPNATIAIIYPDNSFGTENLDGLKEALSSMNSSLRLVGAQGFADSDPSHVSQMQALAQTNADVLISVGAPKATVLTLTAFNSMKWRPYLIVQSVASGTATMNQAGVALINELQPLTAKYIVDPGMGDAKTTPGLQKLAEIFRAAGEPDLINDPWVMWGAAPALTTVWILRNMECPTRASMMETVRNMSQVSNSLLLPGITLSTSEASGDQFPMQSLYLAKWTDGNWKLFGDIIHTAK